MPGCLVAKAKVAGSNPVFRSNYGPEVPGELPRLRGLLVCVDRLGSVVAVVRSKHFHWCGRRRRHAFARHLRERGSHVLYIEVRVAVGHPPVQMADDLLNDAIRNSEADEQGVRRVSQFVELHLHRLWRRPQPHAALRVRVQRGWPRTRATAFVGVLRFFVVRLAARGATATLVNVARDDSGAPQRAAQDLLDSSSLWMTVTGGVREEVRTPGLQRFLDILLQRRRNRSQRRQGRRGGSEGTFARSGKVASGDAA
jgi:hypothetical protein